MSYFLYCLVKKENIIIASLFFLLSWQEFAISLIWTSLVQPMPIDIL